MRVLGCLSLGGLDVEVDHVEGVLLDELAPGLDGVAHEDGEDLVGTDRVVHTHLEKGARLRIHRGLPELLRVHLPQPLVALEGHALFGGAHDDLDELVERAGDHFLARIVHDGTRALVERRDLRVALEELGVVVGLEQVRAENGRVRPCDLDHRGVAVVTARELSAPPVDLARHLTDGRGDLVIAHAPLGAPELLPQQPVEDDPGHAATRELGEQRLELERPLERLEERLLLDRLGLARNLDGGLLDPLGEEELLHLALAHQVPLGLSLLDLEKRRLGDEEPPRLDDLYHVAEEERQQQRPDVRAVHVSVGHQDDFVVAELRDVELFGPDSRPQCRDQQPDFLVREDLVIASLLGIDDLAPQRQDGLRLPIPSLLGRAAGRVALHEKDLAELGIALGAVRELRRQPLVVAPALARELPRLPGRLPRLGRSHALVGDLPRRRRVLLEGLGQPVVDDLLNQTLDFRVPELRFGLPFELRIRDAHGNDGRQAFAEACQVCPTFARIDVVGERENALLVTVVVLQRHLDLDVVLLALEEEHLGMDGRLVLVQVLDELDDAALVEERVGALVTLVLDDDLETLVEEGHLAEAVRQRVEGERGLLEDLRVGLEANDRAVLRGLLSRREVALGRAILIPLRPDLAAPPDLELQPLGERVDHRDPDAVQAARHLVGGVLELAAGVEHRQHHLGRRLARLLVRVHRDPAPVVADRARAVRVEDDLDAVAVAAHGLVHGVVHRLVDEMMKSVRARVPDVHGRALADGLEPLEYLDVARGIGFAAHAIPPIPAPMDSATTPPFTSHNAPPFPSGSPGSPVDRNTCPLRAARRSTRPWTSGSSSESASSSSKTGGLPTAASTGPASASRSAKTRSLCWPREPKLRISWPSSSTTRSSRCGPTSVSRLRISSSRPAASASRNSPSVVSGPSADRYSRRTAWFDPASSG